MKTRDILKKHILELESGDGICLSDLVYWLSDQSFNTKGQDLEKFLFGLIKGPMESDQIKIEISENKLDKDIPIENDKDHDVKGFSLKNYTPTRIQITTFKDFLSQTISKCSNYQEKEFFSKEDIDLLKDYIKKCFKEELTIITVFDSEKSKSAAFFFDVEKMIESIQSMFYFIAAQGGKTEHKRIVLLQEKNMRLTLDLGTNPLNRGVWVEKIDVDSPPCFFETILCKEIDPKKYNKISTEDFVKHQINYLKSNWKKIPS